MAKATLGILTAHGPTLNVPGRDWDTSVPKDKQRRHWHQGKEYSYDELVALADPVAMERETALDVREARFAECQTAIERMKSAWERVSPDVCIIFGNDQRELIQEDLQPAFCIYTGETFFHEPLAEHRKQYLPPGVKESEWAYRPENYTDYTSVPSLAQAIFKTADAEGFDLASIQRWPDSADDHFHTGAPHAFGFIIRRIMDKEMRPLLPLFINTFYGPNQPSARRAFQFGRMIGKAIKAWDEDKTVAIVGSGGLSHFVVDEDLDRRLMKAISDRDEAAMIDFDRQILMSGTSELLNWIAAAGAMFESDLKEEFAEYVPCYRSEAGTGAGNGFVVWS